MFIAGNFTKRDSQAYINFIQASTSKKEGEHVYVSGARERCDRADVEQGITVLEAFVKAFADLATGRGEKKLTPFDLIMENARPANLDEIKATRDTLGKEQMVTVPFLKFFDEETTQVLKVFIDHDNPVTLPEPMAVASKGALNLMEMNKEKVILACGEASSAGEESDSSSTGQSSFRTPTPSSQERSDIPEYVSILTPSPQQHRN